MSGIAFAWEIGAGRGHAGPMLPIAVGLARRGHVVKAYLREPGAASGLPDAKEIAVLPAPLWVGPVIQNLGLNFGEVLFNFGFRSEAALIQLVEAWRERLDGVDLLVTNVAPGAIVAARTLGVPYLEASQGFHVPPPIFPSPPLRDWEPAPRQRVVSADRQVLQSINGVLGRYGALPIQSLGDLFIERTLLLTYPELEMYPERGRSEYYGITPGAGRKILQWPAQRPRILAYLYHYYPHLDTLLPAISRAGGTSIIVIAGAAAGLIQRHASDCLQITTELLDFPAMATNADLVICHASHQTTAEALLSGCPLLLLPTQLEQFLTTRRVIRFGAALGIDASNQAPNFDKALSLLFSEPRFLAKAREFSRRYGEHEREAALNSILDRCERELPAQ